jgi:hypothetical protein
MPYSTLNVFLFYLINCTEIMKFPVDTVMNEHILLCTCVVLLITKAPHNVHLKHPINEIELRTVTGFQNEKCIS